jgi:hypothetical protein
MTDATVDVQIPLALVRQLQAVLADAFAADPHSQHLSNLLYELNELAPPRTEPQEFWIVVTAVSASAIRVSLATSPVAAVGLAQRGSRIYARVPRDIAVFRTSQAVMDWLATTNHPFTTVGAEL